MLAAANLIIGLLYFDYAPILYNQYIFIVQGVPFIHFHCTGCPIYTFSLYRVIHLYIFILQGVPFIHFQCTRCSIYTLSMYHVSHLYTFNVPARCPIFTLASYNYGTSWAIYTFSLYKVIDLYILLYMMYRVIYFQT